MEDKPRLLITLVHGTFAGNAKWVFEEDSVLRTAIREAFGDEVKFETFKWGTLNNTHHHRLNAGAKLALQHNEFMNKHPGSPSFIIGHSHGGNVAMYALRDLKQMPAGIVTMGTPFITCEPRNIKASEFMLKMVFACFAFFLGIFAMGLSVLLFWELLLRHLPDGLRFCAFFFGIYIAIIPFKTIELSFKLFPNFVRWARGKQFQIIQRIRLPKTDVPLLCIHVAGDEAGLVLRTAQAIANIPYRIWNRTFGAVVFILLFSFIWLKSSSPGHPSYSPSEGPYELIFKAVLIAALGLTLLAFFWQVVMLTLPRLVRSHALFFGGESFLDNWLARIGTFVMPVEAPNSTERKYAPRRRRFWGVPLPDLLHSWMYNDPAAVSEIVTWLRDRLPKSGTCS